MTPDQQLAYRTEAQLLEAYSKMDKAVGRGGCPGDMVLIPLSRWEVALVCAVVRNMLDRK